MQQMVKRLQKELEEMWKNMVTVYFWVLSNICLERLRKTTETLSQGCQSLGQGLKLGPP
jgi:hypothetical protein